MTTKSNKFYISAMIASIALIIMMILAMFAYGYAHNNLIVPDNTMDTLSNLINSKSLFLYEIIAWVLIIIADLLVTWAFYIYLKDINSTQSLLAGILRLVYTGILAISVANLFRAYQLLGNQAEISLKLANDINISIQSFENIWSLGLIIFGAHLFMVGFVAYQSSAIPKLVSILLIIAGLSYTTIHIMYGFIPQLDKVTKIAETILSVPMTIGEIGFAIWLLVKGKKLKQVN